MNPVLQRRLSWGALGLILCAVTLLRLPLLDVPLERDEGEYAYMAQLLLDGIPPYTEAYSMKFPGIYFVYAAIISLFGETHTAIHFGLLLANLTTIILVYQLTVRISNRVVGTFSTAAYALLSLSQHVEGIWANAEHFVLPFALGGLLALPPPGSLPTSRKLFIAGVLFSAALLVKQHGLFFALFGFVYVLWVLMQAHKKSVKLIVRHVSSLVAGFLLLPLLTFAYLASTGALDKFIFWTFTYVREYSTDVPLAYAPYIFLWSIGPFFNATFILWLLAGIGLIALLVSSTWKPVRWYIFGFAIASFLAVCPGFWFRYHYFLLLLPALALLAGIGFQWLVELFRSSQLRLVRLGVPAAIALIALAGTLLSHSDALLYSSTVKVTRDHYGLNPFVESIPLAELIQERVAPYETIGVLGSEPQLCFYSKRKSASSYIYMYPLMENHPYVLTMQDEIISQLAAAAPKLIIWVDAHTSWGSNHRSKLKMFDWLGPYVKEYYHPLVRVEMTEGDTPSVWLKGEALNTTPATTNWVTVYERKQHSSD